MTISSTTPGRQSFRDGLAALAAAQKSPRGTAAYSRLVNRPAGRLVAAAANTRGMTPNQATAVSAVLTFSAIATIALATPHWWVGIVVAVLLAAGYVMDSVDGQLARLRGGGSKHGEWLDHTVDTVKTSTLHLAVLISLFRHPVGDSSAWLLIPIGYSVVAAVTYFGWMIMPTLRPPGRKPEPTTPENPLRKYLLLPSDYGALCWVFVLFGWRLGFAVLYGAFGAFAAVLLAAALRKWSRELRALDGTD